MIPALSEVVVPGKLVYSDFRKRAGEVAVSETSERQPGVKVVRCLFNVGTGTNLPVQILNLKSKPMTLPGGARLCSVSEVESVAENEDSLTQPILASVSMPTAVDPVKAEQIQKLLSGVHPDLPSEQRAELKKLLFNFSDISSRDEFDMGLTDLNEHEIDTGQERPVCQALRKTPMAYHEVIVKHVQAMLIQGLIKPSRRIRLRTLS